MRAAMPVSIDLDNKNSSGSLEPLLLILPMPII
jgi:hypothetical protein